MEYKRLMSETEMNQDRRVATRGYVVFRAIQAASIPKKPHPNLIKWWMLANRPWKAKME